MNLDNAVAHLWDLQVESCRYDTLKGELVINLLDGDGKIVHSLNFAGVSLYLYLQNTNNSFSEEDTYKELSSITFKAGLIAAKDISPKYLRPFMLDFNVAIEFLASVTLIKAEKFEVDGMSYKLV